MAIVTVEANALLNSSVKGTAYTAATTPVNLALVTVNGSATAAGTEVTGGSYARLSTSGTFWGSASSGSITNSAGTLSFTAMPAVTVVGIELWDSAGTPIRRWWGALTTSKTLGAGDTLSFATSSITISIS
jgi:hypothetical protein